MPLHPVYGHEEQKARLAGALAAGRLPPALLFVGPPGVGKQRLALWLAAGLLCERGPGEPCDACHSCRLAATLQHPDIHWFFPIPRPKADDASKQVEEAEELLGGALAARRENALYVKPDGLHALFLPLVRLLHRRAIMRPAMGRAKVFIVGDAERLVPQASSPEAANAMLKVLEEPPADTFFALTCAEQTSLLPTIRSRLVPLRVPRLKHAEVVRFLTGVPIPPMDPTEARRRAATAFGSIGAALALAAQGEEVRGAAWQLLDAADGGQVMRRRYALGMRAYGGRGDFTQVLDAAAELLRDELDARLRRPDAAGARRLPAAGLLEALREIERARGWAQRNVNPQLIAAHLMRSLAPAEAS